MKVLTIKQPYATLILEGIKEYEFRTWKTKYRGEFLIHAGLSVDKIAMKKYEYLNLEYPKGCIIGKVTLDDCIKVDNELKEILKEKNPIVYYNAINNENYKGYSFKLKNAEKIKPIKIKGKLSFWEYDYKI